MTTHSTFKQGLLAGFVWCGVFFPVLHAQMAHVGAVRANHGFSEQMGVGFGFHLRGGGLSGGGSSVVGLNPLGQFIPNPQLQQGGVFGGGANGGMFGFGSHGKGGGFSLNFFGSQGASSSIISQTPSLTLTNGVPGYFFDGELRPFVVGFVPVVGGWQRAAPRPQSVLQERLYRLRTEKALPRKPSKRSAARANASSGVRRAPAAVSPISRLPENDDAPLILRK